MPRTGNSTSSNNINTDKVSRKRKPEFVNIKSDAIPRRGGEAGSSSRRINTEVVKRKEPFNRANNTTDYITRER